MLAARPYDTERNHWFLSKHDPSSQKPSSPRMSNHCATSLATQSEWKGHYAYPNQTDVVTFNHPFERSHEGPGLRHGSSSASNDRNNAVGLVVEQSRPLWDQQHGRSISEILQTEHSQEGSDRHPQQLTSVDILKEKTAGGTSNESLGSSSDLPEPRKLSDSVSELPVQDGRITMLKEDEDEGMDEDEIEEGDGDHCPQGATLAERAAARRKMKRFRLTHQQTRFLMSEFVKQPHPDAGHRERLSQEIPGLSPRQVQVWFQNRRAKIKRLNAEDRDRMIKMRAVPENFDNVQALHSPYGAVHGISPPLSASAELGNQPYGEQLMRPLMIDVRRPEANGNMSPSGLTPSFGTVGFNSHGVTNSEILSPLSTTSNERYTYGSHMSSPLSAGTRNTNPFSGRQGSLDSTMHMSRQGMDALQPLRLGDSISRPRTDSVPSPLRSAVSWKGETLDYTSYQANTANLSPSIPERQQSVYQMGPSSGGSIAGYDSDAYSGHTTQSSSGLDVSTMPGGLQGRSRLRAASATFPLSLDMRAQHRPPGSSAQSVNYSMSNRTTTPSSQYSNSSLYTTSYPSAPLTAPIHTSQPKPSNERGGSTDFARPQMSAPISATGEFSRPSQVDTRGQAGSGSPIKQSFDATGGPAYSPTQERNEPFPADVSGAPSLQRKSSYSFPANNTSDRTASGPHVF